MRLYKYLFLAVICACGLCSCEGLFGGGRSDHMRHLSYFCRIEGEQGASITVDYVDCSGTDWKNNIRHSKKITLPYADVYRGEIDLADNGRVPSPFLTTTNTTSEPLCLLLYGDLSPMTLADGNDYHIFAVIAYNEDPVLNSDVPDNHKMTMAELYSALEECGYTGYRVLAPGETGTVTIPVKIKRQ